MTFHPDLALEFFRYRTALTGLWVVLLLGLGAWRTLRPASKLEPTRVLRNFALGGITEVIQHWVAAPVLAILAGALLEIRPGLLPSEWPWAVRALLGLLLLDGLLYFWHRLNHIIPFLWRFHRVHHSDPVMDASTAVRFHPGEFLLATATSTLQLWVVGFDPATYVLYDFCVMLAVPFHHANLRLPQGWDRAIQSLLITPELHAIHHSVRAEETNSNYGTIFSFWDRIFGTRKLRGPAADIEIGVLPAARQEGIDLLISPFRRTPDAS